MIEPTLSELKAKLAITQDALRIERERRLTESTCLPEERAFLDVLIAQGADRVVISAKGFSARKVTIDSPVFSMTAVAAEHGRPQTSLVVDRLARTYTDMMVAHEFGVSLSTPVHFADPSTHLSEEGKSGND
jgi:hypothetical protein